MCSRLSVLVARFLFPALVVAVPLMILGCSSAGAGPGSSGVATADAVAATQTVAGAVGIILQNQGNWTTSGSNVSFTSNYGVSMTGTNVVGSSTSTMDLTITFSNYSDSATGYTVNGSGVLSLTTNNSTGAATSGSITTNNGDLVLSGGKVTSETWDITDVTSTGGGSPIFSFTGTVTCNGASFNANSLSLPATNVAAVAATAVGNGVSLMINNQSSWSCSSGNCTYSYSNVSMTGTEAASGSDTIYTLKLTYNGYADSSGYTLSSSTGALTYVETVVTSSSTVVSASISGGPVLFSGGTVTSQTWNDVQVTNSGATVTGTVSSDGTLFDAKTLVP